MDQNQMKISEEFTDITCDCEVNVLLLAVVNSYSNLENIFMKLVRKKGII